MKHILTVLFFATTTLLAQGKKNLSINDLWSIKRLSVYGLSSDRAFILYTVSTPDIQNNTFDYQYFKAPVSGKTPISINRDEWEVLTEKKHPTSNSKLSFHPVKINPVEAKDFYSDLPSSDAKIYSSLDHRHWDKWTNGTFNHVFIVQGDKTTDIMEGLAYYCPQEPFPSDEDFTWSASGDRVFYVAKAKVGTPYALSTNTDIFEYDTNTHTTRNLTPDNLGYDTSPKTNKNNVLAYLSMKTDGYEADKNDIIIISHNQKINLTESWDGTVKSFQWSDDGKKIYFIAPTDGTLQLFEIDILTKKIQQLTNGIFDVNQIVGQAKHQLFVTKSNMNRAKEIFSFDLKTKTLKPFSHINDQLYAHIADCPIEKRYFTTTDGKKMLSWIIFPPNFNPEKKYPTILYCQGGPQSELTQFYSFRWNFQLMASKGYIVIAPNRRGMPGFGVDWNKQISKDWGGQVMQDYLSAIDQFSKEPYVDTSRRAAVGASFGGYSVFYLAGIHKNRFKSFISHCGVFNTESMYGTTDETFFNNFEFGGAYWQKNQDTENAYNAFNPLKKVNKWNTPILIIQGGKDYRVTEDQALQAFTAAQLLGVKSKLLYFPSENHWIVRPQNGILWQRTFFNWLSETL